MNSLAQLPTEELEAYLALAQHNAAQVRQFIVQAARELRRRRE